MTWSHFSFRNPTGETQFGSKPTNGDDIELHRNYHLQKRHTTKETYYENIVGTG